MEELPLERVPLEGRRRSSVLMVKRKSTLSSAAVTSTNGSGEASSEESSPKGYPLPANSRKSISARSSAIMPGRPISTNGGRRRSSALYRSFVLNGLDLFQDDDPDDDEEIVFMAESSASLDFEFEQDETLEPYQSDQDYDDDDEIILMELDEHLPDEPSMEQQLGLSLSRLEPIIEVGKQADGKKTDTTIKPSADDSSRPRPDPPVVMGTENTLPTTQRDMPMPELETTMCSDDGGLSPINDKEKRTFYFPEPSLPSPISISKVLVEEVPLRPSKILAHQKARDEASPTKNGVRVSRIPSLRESMVSDRSSYTSQLGATIQMDEEGTKRSFPAPMPPLSVQTPALETTDSDKSSSTKNSVPRFQTWYLVAFVVWTICALLLGNYLSRVSWFQKESVTSLDATYRLELLSNFDIERKEKQAEINQLLKQVEGSNKELFLEQDLHQQTKSQAEVTETKWKKEVDAKALHVEELLGQITALEQEIAPVDQERGSLTGKQSHLQAQLTANLATNDRLIDDLSKTIRDLEEQVEVSKQHGIQLEAANSMLREEVAVYRVELAPTKPSSKISQPEVSQGDNKSKPIEEFFSRARYSWKIAILRLKAGLYRLSKALGMEITQLKGISEELAIAARKKTVQTVIRAGQHLDAVATEVAATNSQIYSKGSNLGGSEAMTQVRTFLREKIRRRR